MKRVWFTWVICVAACLAADISGNWKATASGPNGNMERSFVFKVEGSKVTGETTSSMMGKSTISEGKLEGDTVTFTITGNIGGNEMKLNYKGKISGDEIHFTSEMAGGGGGQAIEWTAKRAK